VPRSIARSTDRESLDQRVALRPRHLPAAIPATEGQVWGEVHQMMEPGTALTTLDEIEGYSAAAPDASLYRRVEIPVTFEDGRMVQAWVYFYNAPLGRAERIASGDYLQHLKIRYPPQRASRPVLRPR
jgi:gamma-glutamylcyclotransferase (GGCT)/AIG2-like uncharacterized protein YtfP